MGQKWTEKSIGWFSAKSAARQTAYYNSYRVSCIVTRFCGASCIFLDDTTYVVLSPLSDTRVEIPAIVDRIEGALTRMRKCSQQHDLNIDASVAPTFRLASGVGRQSVRAGLKAGAKIEPPAGLKAGATNEESFWVNIIGRGCPPPNRTFRWCTQRMKIDPVNVFV